MLKITFLGADGGLRRLVRKDGPVQKMTEGGSADGIPVVDVLLIGHEATRLRLEASSLAEFRVAPVPSIEEALHLLMERRADALLLDLTRAEDGLHELAHARFALETLPSIVILDQANQQLEKAALRMGAEDVVVEPAPTESTLPLAITRAIERHQRLVRLRQQQRLSHLHATRDHLTGLLNRPSFEDGLQRLIAAAERHCTQMAVLFIDLDGFKGINDTHGHAVGDRVLESLAQSLSRATRKCDLLARFGGDEFVLASQVASIKEAETLASHLIAACAAGPPDLPWPGLSVGIACFPDDGRSVEDLLVSADTAMYRSKSTGGGSWMTLNEDVTSRAVSPTAYRPPTREVEVLLCIGGEWRRARVVLPKNRVLIDHLNQSQAFLKIRTNGGFLAARLEGITLLVPRSRGPMVYESNREWPRQRVRCELSGHTLVGSLPLRPKLRLSDVLAQADRFLVLEEVDNDAASLSTRELALPRNVVVVNAQSLLTVEELA